MEPKYIFRLFVILAIIQLSIPGYMIGQQELTLRTGNKFKLKIAPVDPVDAFRGRYLAIRIENNDVFVEQVTQWQRGESVYAVIEKDKAGWLQVTNLSSTEPKADNYLQVTVDYIRPDQNRVYLEFPFSRYYLPEEIASDIEERFQRLSNRQGIPAYITVRIKNGLGVIEELYLAGEPISSYSNLSEN